jgi:amidase
VPARSLAELIAWNEAHEDLEMPWFGQEIFLQAQEKGVLTDAAYVEARARCLRLAKEQGIDAVTRQHRLDAFVAPTCGPAWLTDWVNGDHYTGGCSTAAAVAGAPHVTVPAGALHGLPIGLSFFGVDWSEARLLQLAFAFERETQARRAPDYRPTIA